MPAHAALCWRLRRLDLEPAHRPAFDREEGVPRADPGPGEIAALKRVGAAVEDDVDVAIEDEIRLLERVVVVIADAALGEFHREHVYVDRAEVAIDEIADREAVEVAMHMRARRHGAVMMADKLSPRIARRRRLEELPPVERLDEEGGRQSAGG